MRRTRAVAFAFALLVMLTANGHEPEKSIHGVYATASRAFEVDLDPNDTRKGIYLELHGDVGKEMYQAMNGEVRKDACGLDEIRLKQTENVVCMLRRASGEYECVFVLNSESGALENVFFLLTKRLDVTAPGAHPDTEGTGQVGGLRIPRIHGSHWFW